MKRSVFSGRRAHLALLAGIASLAMAGCTEESFNGITLYAENHTNGTKTVVNGTNIAWADGDMVDINGTPYTISNANTSAQLTGVKAVVGDDLYALYPAGIGTRTDNTLALNLPSSYTYQKDASGKQIIAFPMVAKGTMVEENGELRFKHLCAAIDVKVKNPASNPNTLHLNSITLTSATGQISGARTVTIDDWSNPTIAPADADAADESAKSVTLVFSNDVALEPGDEAQFQLPIYPLASGQDLTFTIEANKSTIEGVMVTDIVHNTKTVTLTAEIPRAQVAFTPAISLDDATTVTPTSFSVSGTDKIYFSAGNLNYSDKFTFIEDLDSYVLDKNGHIINKKYDEGGGFCFPFSFITSNGLINGWDETQWRVLTRDEWTYLLHARLTGVTIAEVENANAIFCKINNRKGLLVIPDNFVMPVTTVEWNANSINRYRTSTKVSVTYTPLTTADWKTLEAAGCIFLPRCGWSKDDSGDGYYWSATESSDINAYGIHFNNGGLNLYGVREASTSGSSIWEKQKSNYIAIRVVTDAQ